MKLFKCDRCGKISTNNKDSDFVSFYVDKEAFDLCPDCVSEYKEIKKCMTRAFIKYKKIEITILETKQDES